MSKKILVCDDDQGILELIKSILEDNGYQVKTVATGKGIQKRISEFEPKIILLDIWMPGIDGRDVTRLLKSKPETKAIPIIILSALSDTKQIAEEIGADSYLTKPFDINNLLKTVANYMPE